jgi:hypothetical protein
MVLIKRRKWDQQELQKNTHAPYNSPQLLGRTKDFQQVIPITQKRLIENYLRKLKGSGKYFEVKEET